MAYRTLAGRGEAAFEIRGSEFVGHAAPVHTVADAEDFVAEVRTEYPDASHVVPCYRVREGDPETGVLVREWQSDDGEPSGSSGGPALNVLVQRDIENVVAAVVRYFGGTELGVGGLARAYSRGVKEAVDDAGVVEEVPHETFTLTTTYDDSGTVRSVLESAGADFDADYGETVTFEVRAPRESAPALRERIRSATSGRVG
ncbi:MAG: YigZ family protein [Halobacteriaceae archaeon]